MKLDLPKILMSIILAITLQSGYCELKNPIDILQVDSVEVLAVNPFTLSEFRVDRLHFDDVFRIYNMEHSPVSDEHQIQHLQHVIEQNSDISTKI